MAGSNATDQKKPKGAAHWALFALRWGIFALGVWYVVHSVWFRDQAYVLDANNRPVKVALDRPTPEDAATFPAWVGGKLLDVRRDRVVNEPDAKQVNLRVGDTLRRAELLGVDVAGNVNVNPHPVRYLVADPPGSDGRWVAPGDLVGYRFPSPYPYTRDLIGLDRMVQHADAKLLWAALLVFPLTFVLTSYRWHELLKVLDIDLSFGRAFVLNMVGSFWNTCIPGSTGGDVLKAVYVSKMTPHRTRAVMSVLVDRAVGLLALVILGGAMAAFQWQIPACRKVAVASAAMVACTAAGMLVFYHPTLHRLSGLDAILRRLPKQKQVRGAVDAMLRYGKAPTLSAWSLVVSFPVHATVVTSAMLAGMALGLPLHWAFYWVCVPVIVLAAAIPISVQGAGVMESLAFLLTHGQGVTSSQAVALAMSVRVVQMVWNLTGGVFVLRGRFHGSTDDERASLDNDGGGSLPGGTGEPAVAV